MRQAVDRRRGERRRIRSASSVAIKRGAVNLLRRVLRTLPSLIYVAVLILASWLLYYSLTSPYFALQEVTVSGTRLLDPEQARSAVGPVGQNVLRLQPEALEQSVRKLSVIRDVRVTALLPGRVEIDVTERTPRVQWQAPEGSFLVDREGVVFSKEPPPDRVMVVRGLDGPPMEVGSKLDPEVLESIATVDKQLPERAGIKPSWYDYSWTSGIVIPAQGGPRIVLGDVNDLDEKLATLGAIRGYLAARNDQADTIDLRFKDRPVYVSPPPVPTKPAPAR